MFLVSTEIFCRFLRAFEEKKNCMKDEGAKKNKKQKSLFLAFFRHFFSHRDTKTHVTRKRYNNGSATVELFTGRG